MGCSVGVAWGEQLLSYSFPAGHPMNLGRLAEFSQSIEKTFASNRNLKRVLPCLASREETQLFHTPECVEMVIRASRLGKGYLDAGDTPAYPGVFEAASWVVGTTLNCLRLIEKGLDFAHAFNPVGGLHHARPASAGGFCVFNDAATAIAEAHRKHPREKILYVDIDAHHGDGVFYPFEGEPWLYIVDVHEDGRYLYPGTGWESETGTGIARGTKRNFCLAPGAGDKEFADALKQAEELFEKASPWIVILQAGADGLEGDPITHLRYSQKVHELATRKVHEISHKHSEGRLLVLGGGGYNPRNVSRAWMKVLETLTQ